MVWDGVGWCGMVVLLLHGLVLQGMVWNGVELCGMVWDGGAAAAVVVLQGMMWDGGVGIDFPFSLILFDPSTNDKQ
ncbi:unnamed protein product [Cylicostephanus goldi]|uniref:Uncharacterized protein n=1 Tax=Cylicostephanus goldi TaxID=71465 RepID=A0A3P7NRY6_CYLGO|nr:unnamed protein product [Cylicostephanus goldi]